MRDERERLLAWYDREARDLPWRRTSDPYAIWVSEVMLQQTRVDTVIPYFERFIARFPTAVALADASEDDVLAAWSGLGYYRRARLLHAGVREVAARYGGTVPSARDARLALPGIGRYTAGAIGSIAFDHPEPIVDGNVARVLARVHAIETPLGVATTERALWEKAQQWVVGSRPGALNQALMELGATVCTVAAPRCERCPIASCCMAYATDRVAELPRPKERRAPKRVQMVAVVAGGANGERIWLCRSSGSLFGGLWNLPMSEGEGRLAAERALTGAGLVGRIDDVPFARFRHVLTHRELDIAVHRASVAVPSNAPNTKLVDPRDLSRVGVSSLTRKVLASACNESAVPDAPAQPLRSRRSVKARQAKSSKQAPSTNMPAARAQKSARASGRGSTT